MQAGAFDLVGTIIYEIDGKPYQSTFYNGTIEVVEDGPLFRMESVFLSGLLISVIIVLIIYIQNGLRHMTKVREIHPISLSYRIFRLMLCPFLLGKTILKLVTNIENGYFLAQKTKRAPKVEVGTATKDASLDEWLEVLA